MSSSPVAVIKRGGSRPTEELIHDKLHSSVYAACLSVRTPEGEAAHIATAVSEAVGQWCAKKLEVTSADIRRKAAEYLEQFHSDAAYLYKHHGLVL